MKRATQRKLAFGLLGVAAAALVLDRTVLSPGGGSAATPDAAPKAQPSGAAPLQIVVGSPATREQPPTSGKLSSRLNIALDSPKWTADQVVGSLRSTPQWVNGQQADSGAQSAQTGFNAHVLKAVMNGKSESSRIALIDGKPMKVGDTLDGYTLVSVGARSAVFELGSSRIVLNLPGAPEHGAIAGTPDR